jgi:membrane protein DedA with SNARE-associated domain
MDPDLLAWLARYGAPVLFLAQLFGIFGLPIPDELLLTAAGVLVRNGRLPGVPTIAAAIGGCAAGITISYTLGRTVGIPTLQRVMHVPPEALQRAQTWFRRFGRWLLAFGYFIPGVRHVTALAAGSTLDYKTFARYAYPGAVLWSSTFVGLGYFAGDRWQVLYALVREHSTQVVIAGAIAAAGYLIWIAASRPERHAMKRKPRSYRG